MRGWIGTVLAAGVFAAVQIAAAEGSQRPSGEMRIEREVEAACREIDAGQAALSDRCSLADYRAFVRAVNGTNMWTAALQKALDEHEIVTIPASPEKYFFDGTVVVPSRRRIEAKGATIRLADGMRTVLLRNASAQDGTLAPIPVSAKRDTDIAIVGGRWEDCCTRRAGYGRTGMFNLLPRRKGNYFGVSTLFFFNNVNRLSVTGATFHHTGGFAVQAGDGDAVAFRDISFDRCFADGLHLNGNLTRVLARNVRGQVGDDLVALNAYDWLNSSVDFGPQRYILCEDLELVRLPGVPAYPAIRIQPAKYRYADGSVVDCAISDVIFRRVKGITTYKMYLQTPRYTIGSTPEWAEVGSGGNLFFSDLEIDLDAPIDKIGQYATQEAPRGHFAAFEFGANLSLVHFKNIDITFHADRWPLTHLVQVGPKSCFYPGKDGKPGTEIFDPYVSCRVERVVLENVRVHGTPPTELVYSAAFDDINKDGRSTGRGVIEKIVEARGMGDVARVKGTDGVWREVPLMGVREADGGVRYTFPAAEARKAQIVQFWLDRAQAKTGEEGFWMGGRGVVGYFTREKMHWGNGAQFMDHPYFAMQTPRGAFIAIVEGMRFEFNAIVEAKGGQYRAYPSWNIEQHALGEVYEDLSLVVYDLGKDADWNVMAKAYRRRVLAREGASRRIETLKERAKARPHLLKMANAIALRRRHACKPYVFKDPKYDVDFTPETEKKPQCLYSFAQTLAFLQRLKALGVDDVALCVAGWQDGGYDGRCPSSFPVSPEAGGEAELRKLIRGGQALGYIIDGHSNYTDCYAVSPMWDNGNIACKFPDGSIQRCHDAFAGGRAYRLCLKNAWETFLPGELEKIAALGFRGAHYIDVFTAVYPYACCDPHHRANRKEIAAYQRQVVERCIELFGGFSSECDMDHLIGLVDYVNYNTREIKNAQNARAKGRNLPFDRIVPFSELAFHDYLLANPDKSTQEFPSGQNWLDLVEFGGRPIVYNFTDADAEKIRDLYLRFKPLRHLQLEEMVEHRDVAPGVVRVTYGDGSRVYVNHTDALVEADGVRVPAMDYLLLRAAENTER